MAREPQRPVVSASPSTEVFLSLPEQLPLYLVNLLHIFSLLPPITATILYANTLLLRYLFLLQKSKENKTQETPRFVIPRPASQISNKCKLDH